MTQDPQDPYSVVVDLDAEIAARESALDGLVSAGDPRARLICEAWSESPSEERKTAGLHHLLDTYGSVEHARRARAILLKHGDFDWYVLMPLSQALGSFALKFGKEQAPIVRALSKVIRECADPNVRAAAYGSILMLLDNTWFPREPEDVSAADVDWKRIDDFLSTRAKS